MNENRIDALLKEEKRLNQRMHDLYSRRVQVGVPLPSMVREENEIDYHLAEVYRKLGEEYWKQGRVIEAQENYRMAKELFERVGADDKAAECLKQIRAISASINCPNCGFSNPLGSKFCNQCGRKL